jgi:hypothetical protein
VNEYLGRSDAGIILLRKLWLRELDALETVKPTKAWHWSTGLDATVGVAADA